jgi:hypothetical protein
MLFSYGRAVEGKYFYDRAQIQKELSLFIEMKQSFMLKAPRRYGKTSLIKHLFFKKYTSINIDLRRVPSLSLINDKLFDFIYKEIGIVGFLQKTKKNIISFMNEHRAKIKINVKLFEISMELFANTDINEEERLSEILDLADQFAKELNTTFYIIFDEFQDIKRFGSRELDILELLRGTIQHHQHITYIFLGSNMTLMTKIFENKKSPFFNFCRKKNLKPFDAKELSLEIIKAFKSKNIIFEDEKDLIDILNKLNGHPANTILTMQNLEIIMYSKDVKLIKKENVKEAYKRAYEELQDLIVEYTKEIQTKEHLYDVIYRLATAQKQILDSKSIYQKYSILVDMGYIQKIEKGKYFIVDNFLQEYLKSTK